MSKNKASYKFFQRTVWHTARLCSVALPFVNGGSWAG